ncbi:PfkB family carbohydrate kinase [Saccharothrix obliqua]|uniref:PfkB family carbohydrate kinase n=1 Tax=Saccharothrix obliqua TaxID=2861747 RepID=UPI001C5D2EC3|nr:PfkB family carbohydrate kinase [Saccharothrix obliqua]MBW4715624.1 carbohydrate kinase [Saccharothrix obliqua]
MLCVGLTTVDVSQVVAEFPAPGAKVRSLAVDLAPGGPAANAARAVVALGHRAVLLTALGDRFGPVARELLAGVEAHDLGVGGPPVSAVVVRERDGERTVVSRDAADFTPTGEVDARHVRAADVLLLDGHLGPLALAAARLARAAGVPVVLDAGSWKPVLDDLLPLVDVAACAAGFPLSAPELHARGVPLVVRTAGPAPVTWSRRGVTGRVPVPAVAARDTNGAGDVWHGALAVAVARGLRVAAAIRWANAAAGVRVRNTARDWVAELARWREGG